MTLKERTISALFWSSFELLGQQSIQFVIAVILARLLLPSEFGLIAMLAIFMAVAQSIVDSGFGSALIQKSDSTHVDECSIFYFNIIVGILGAGFLCIAAPLIAEFYSEPLLVPLTQVLSLNLVINAFGLIQVSLLTKATDFKTQSKVSLASVATSGLIGIAMAFHGAGVWSLVVQSICQNLFRTCLLWFFFRWHPSWTFSIRALGTMFRFGSRLLFSGLLDTVFQNIYSVVIGRLFSPADLGFYARAVSVRDLPVQNIASSVGRVTFPVFSSFQNEKERLKKGVQKALQFMALVNFPVLIGLAVVAKPLVVLILTEKWLPCVTYLQLLCVVGILYPLHAINLNVLKAQGRSDIFFRLEVLKKIMAVVAIIVTYRWGISAMICGQIATSLISYYLNSYYTGRLLGYGLVQQSRDFASTLAAACVMGALIYPLALFRLTPSVTLAFQILLGVSVYLLLCRLSNVPAFITLSVSVREYLSALRRKSWAKPA